MPIQTGTEIFRVLKDQTGESLIKALQSKQTKMKDKDQYVTSIESPFNHETNEKQVYLLHWNSNEN